MVTMSHTHLFAKINIFHYWEILGDTQNKSVNITAIRIKINKNSKGVQIWLIKYPNMGAAVHIYIPAPRC